MLGSCGILFITEIALRLVRILPRAKNRAYSIEFHNAVNLIWEYPETQQRNLTTDPMTAVTELDGKIS